MSKEKQLYYILRSLQRGEIGTDLAHLQILRLFVVSGSLQLTDEQTKVLADLANRFIYEGVNGYLRISEFGILEIFHKWKEMVRNDR